MSELFVEKQIESKYGTVRLAITQGNHISAQLTADFRGTAYLVHAHYSCNAGMWQFKDRDSISIRRAWDGYAKNFGKLAAPTHVKAITEELEIVLDAFIVANPADLVEAERKYLTNEIASVYTKIQELADELERMNITHDNLVEQLRQLKAANPLSTTDFKLA